MIGFTPLLNDTDILSTFLRNADGSTRGALACWAIALCAFVILKVPRQVLLACLFAATLTVGLAAIVVDAAQTQAEASAVKQPTSSTGYRGMARVPPPIDKATSPSDPD